VFLVISATVTVLVLVTTNFLSPISRKSERMFTYESRLEPIDIASIQFNIHYYISGFHRLKLHQL
jgi:NADH:ubiquinone oxidoreductase subunit 3 (subunit A)